MSSRKTLIDQKHVTFCCPTHCSLCPQLNLEHILPYFLLLEFQIPSKGLQEYSSSNRHIPFVSQTSKTTPVKAKFIIDYPPELFQAKCRVIFFTDGGKRIAVKCFLNSDIEKQNEVDVTLERPSISIFQVLKHSIQASTITFTCQNEESGSGEEMNEDKLSVSTILSRYFGSSQLRAKSKVSPKSVQMHMLACRIVGAKINCNFLRIIETLYFFY